MSLLIDALKQAEQARQKSEAASETAPELALENLEAEESPADLTPTEPAKIEPVAAPAPDRKTTTTREALRQQAARELFEVKQPAPSQLPLIIAIAGLVVFLAGALYLWWMLQPRGLQPGPALANPPPAMQDTPPAASPTPADIPADKQPSTPMQSASTPPFVPKATTRGATTNANDGQQVAVQSPVRIRRGDDPPPRRPAAPTHPMAAPDDTADGSPSIRHTAPVHASVPARVQRAYDALRIGDLNTARDLYRQALDGNPRNTDALNGLATIALHDGDIRDAERYFRATLDVDPKDAVAATQLALLLSAGDSAEAESRLRSFIAERPNVAPGYFALGNLFTRQARWREAQQAFFQAHTLDPDNPDVLFNLAVSLDHLNQPALARQFYAQALQTADKRPAGFDQAAARTRLQTLTTTPQR